MSENFESDQHALYVGAILGLAMKHGVHLSPTIDDAGNYTPDLVWQPSPDITITFVVPAPPEDWSILEWSDA